MGHDIGAAAAGPHGFAHHYAPRHRLLGINLARLTDEHERFHCLREGQGAIVLQKDRPGGAQGPGCPAAALHVQGLLHHGTLIHPQAKLLGVAAP